MLDSIDRGKLIIFVVLLVANIGIGYYLFSTLLPKEEQLTRELKSYTSRVNSRLSEARKLRDDYVLAQERKHIFEALEKSGIFNDQNRLLFQNVMVDLQQVSGVLNAGYEIDPAEVESNNSAERADHVVLKSDISFDVSSMDDIKIYEFMFWLKQGLPGHVMFDSIALKRTGTVDDEIIKTISLSGPLPLMEAKIKVQWRSMVSKEIIDKQNMQLQGGL